jgi:hypothetical protein
MSELGWTYPAKVGFDNKGAEVQYLTYDLTGAYAPPQPRIDRHCPRQVAVCPAAPAGAPRLAQRHETP